MAAAAALSGQQQLPTWIAKKVFLLFASSMCLRCPRASSPLTWPRNGTRMRVKAVPAAMGDGRGAEALELKAGRQAV